MKLNLTKISNSINLIIHKYKYNNVKSGDNNIIRNNIIRNNSHKHNVNDKQDHLPYYNYNTQYLKNYEYCNRNKSHDKYKS